MIQARDLRLVHSDSAKQFHAMRAGVSDLQCCVARQLVLHARIELLGVRSARVSINHRGGNRTTGLNQRKAAFRWRSSKGMTERLSGSIGIQEKWRRKISERQVEERWARIKDAVSSADGQPSGAKWRPGQTHAWPEIVRVNAIQHALANSGHAGQAILSRCIPRFDNAGGWRPKRKSIAIHLHKWLVKRGVEAADAALRIVWRRIQFVSQSQV